MNVQRVRKMFRRDRGDADPVLTIAAMAVGLLISASIIAATVHVIQTGQKTVQEGQRAITLSTAQRMWAQDAGNASIVRVEGRSAIQFYETNGGDDSAVFTRGSVPPPCRVSSWTIDHSAGTLTDTVSTYANPQCDLDNVSAHPTSTSTVIKLAGLGSAATIQTTNPAGRDLHFDDAGTEIGLNTDVASGDRSTATRSSWWHDGEWASAVVRGASVAGEISLPISGGRPLGIAGSTHLAAATVRGVVSAGGGASLKQYQPVAPSFTVKQSTTAGKAFYGKHEAVEVQIASGKCGPYSTQYTVHLNPSTAGVAPITKKLAPSFAASLKVTLAPVPNGSAGAVTVSAECPAAVQLGAAQAISKRYIQALPTPQFTSNPEPSGSNHIMSWGRVSSLPSNALAYEVRRRINHGSWGTYRPAKGALNYSHHWTVRGSRYGYEVRAKVTGGAPSGWSAEQSVITPPTTPGLIFGRNPAPAKAGFTVTGSGGRCYGGMTTIYQVKASATGTTHTGSRSPLFTDHWNYGGTYYYQVKARCSGGPWSAIGSANLRVTAPIPANPAGVYATYVRGFGGGGSVSIHWNKVSGATKYQYEGNLTFDRGGGQLRSTGWIGHQTASVGTHLALSACGAGNGFLGGAAARVRAGNSSGWNRHWTYATPTKSPINSCY